MVKLESKIPQVNAKIEQLAIAVVRKVAFDLMARAQNAAPVDTGFLKGSIQAKQLGAMLWQITVGAEYGIYVELGTTTQAPQPYLLPAAEAVRPGFEAAFKQINSL